MGVIESVLMEQYWHTPYELLDSLLLNSNYSSQHALNFTCVTQQYLLSYMTVTAHCSYSEVFQPCSNTCWGEDLILLQKHPWCNTELPDTDLAASYNLGTWSRSEAQAAATIEYQGSIP